MTNHIKKVLTIVGARPQFIKAAPISRALREAGIKEILLHTGQHFDDAMSAQFFRELDIPSPDYHFAIHGLNHGAMTGRMLEAIEEVLLKEKPDLMIVYGDTNSTLAGALAAAKLTVPVAHVEAGLRSFNRSMPEEINRVLVDHLSTLLFCPTQAAIAHLKAENITKAVFHVGDVLMDVSLIAAKRAAKESAILGRLALTPKSYSVCTLHRADNTDDPIQLAELIGWLDAQASQIPMVLPLHPRTKHAIEKHNLKPHNIRMIEPLGYLDMTALLQHAQRLYTDSGGLQKEAYFHRVPCVTLREETEWVETIEAGWNRLWRTDGYKPRHEIDAYGDGEASVKIVQHIQEFLTAR